LPFGYSAGLLKRSKDPAEFKINITITRFFGNEISPKGNVLQRSQIFFPRVRFYAMMEIILEQRSFPKELVMILGFEGPRGPGFRRYGFLENTRP
jgi:hypothetical protein